MLLNFWSGLNFSVFKSKKALKIKAFKLERAMGFGPTTSTLATPKINPNVAVMGILSRFIILDTAFASNFDDETADRRIIKKCQTLYGFQTLFNILKYHISFLGI